MTDPFPIPILPSAFKHIISAALSERAQWGVSQSELATAWLLRPDWLALRGPMRLNSVSPATRWGARRELAVTTHKTFPSGLAANLHGVDLKRSISLCSGIGAM